MTDLNGDCQIETELKGIDLIDWEKFSYELNVCPEAHGVSLRITRTATSDPRHKPNQSTEVILRFAAEEALAVGKALISGAAVIFTKRWEPKTRVDISSRD